jgi:tRNA pseudouridine38-40 synthase
MNIFIEVEYDGIDYAGWQFQPRRKTIQGELERALNRLTQTTIKTIGASRTDAGVSAYGQVVNFHIEFLQFQNLKNFLSSLNAVLPDEINIRQIKIVSEDFHARFDSKGKIYQYKILTDYSPLRRRFSWYVPYELDLGRIKKAMRLFLKQKDYAAFCKVSDKDGNVIMKSLSMRKTKDEIDVRIEANRFLYKMVRRIVGALVDIGRGHRSEDDIKKALAGLKHRPLMCAPANGLTLVKVKY